MGVTRATWARRPMVWLCAAVALFVSGCSADLTELVVVVDSDLGVPGELDTVELVVEGPSGAMQSERVSLVTGDTSLPLVLFLEPVADALGPVTVTASGRARDAVVVVRQARTAFLLGQRRMLRLVLARDCRMVMCGTDQTCADGTCQSIDVVPEDLPVWTAVPPAIGNIDAAADSGSDTAVRDSGADTALDTGAGDTGADTRTDSGTCGAGFGDCDGDVSNGCETPLTTVSDCGLCGVRCSLGNASESCATGTCALVMCDAGFGDCDRDVLTGCEAPLNTAMDCGACGAVCSGAGASCVAGICERTLTLTAIADTYVDNSAPSTNFGADPALLIDAAPDAYAILIMPSSLSAIPAGATILSGSLELTCTDTGGIAGAYRILAPWNESVVTWTSRPAIEATTFTTFSPAVGPVSVDITVVIQEWLSGATAPNGVFLESSDGDGSDYHSTDSAMAASRPRIVIRYR